MKPTSIKLFGVVCALALMVGLLPAVAAATPEGTHGSRGTSDGNVAAGAHSNPNSSQGYWGLWNWVKSLFGATDRAGFGNVPAGSDGQPNQDPDGRYSHDSSQTEVEGDEDGQPNQDPDG